MTSFLREHEHDFLYVHVSKTDRDGYLRVVPFHTSIVIPVGVEEENLDVSCVEQVGLFEKVSLLFVGSLSVEMNFDALKLFAEKFYPLLKEELGSDLEVLVVGSNPSKEVQKLCSKLAWSLFPDVSDKHLRYLYSISMFSILPFKYATGGKLKLLKSMANGVPYLGTPVLCDHPEKVIYPCGVSSDPKEWLMHIRTIRKRGITEGERMALIDYAKEKSWSSVAYNMFQSLCYGLFMSNDTKSNVV